VGGVKRKIPAQRCSRMREGKNFSENERLCLQLEFVRASGMGERSGAKKGKRDRKKGKFHLNY